MTESGIIGMVLILANLVVSYKGFKDKSFFDGHKFQVDKILIDKDYKRLVTSGFLHANWSHLIFNMISLYLFSSLLEQKVGVIYFMLIYFTSLVGGNLLALFVHKEHGDYAAIGASGAVCGIIFASIALFPKMGMGFIMLPISIPSWIYGLLYVGYSIYGIKSQKGNIGHEAHLGGALIGMLIAIVLHPNAMVENYITISIITIPTLIFIYLIVMKPHILLVDSYNFKNRKPALDMDHEYNENKVNQQKELDKLLDKISRKGIDGLSKKERQRLDRYSKDK